jgi:hypothetical protein
MNQPLNVNAAPDAGFADFLIHIAAMALCVGVAVSLAAAAIVLLIATTGNA